MANAVEDVDYVDSVDSALVHGRDLRDIESLMAAATAHEIDGVAVNVVPHGWEAQVVDVEKHLLHPYRRKGTATMSEVESFIAYVSAHKEPGTAVWADSNAHILTARLNGHSPSEISDDDGLLAGWGDHKAVFAMRFSPAWTAWTGFDNRQMDQVSFANFLEERISEIADPPGADLFEVVRTLRVHVNATWENIINTQHNGVQFRWSEDVNTGDVTLPEKLALVLSPFDGGSLVQLEAKLRFTKPDSNGRVKFHYVLGEETRRILDELFGDICQAVLAGTGVPVYRGTFG